MIVDSLVMAPDKIKEGLGADGPPNPRQITQLLKESGEGSAEARNQLLKLVYEELQTIARAQMRGERFDHTLNATALVNEAYLKLFRHSDATEPWSGRSGFYAAAAKAMRRILIDHARAKATKRRGGGPRERRDRVSLDVLTAARDLNPEEFLSLDDAICRLEEVDTRAAAVVRLRFYSGLQQDAVGVVLGVSERTVKRDWEFARAWLADQLHYGG